MGLFLILIVVAVVILVLDYLYRKVYLLPTYWKRQNVPYMPVFPVLGSMYRTFLKKEHLFDYGVRVYVENRDKYKMVGSITMDQPTLMVLDPELIQDITVKKFDHFVNHSRLFINPELDRLFSGNLFWKRGEDWHKMRGILSPSFTGSKLKNMLPLMLKCGEQLSEHVREKFTSNKAIINIELKDLFTKLTADLIATTAFGLEVDSFKNADNEFYKNAKAGTHFSFTRMMFTKMFPGISKLLGIGIVDKKASKFFTSVIFETVKQREQKVIKRPDMINLLIDAKKASIEKHKQDENIPEMDDMDIACQAFLFFIAGFEITAGTMSFACFELAINPDCQKKVHQEIDEILKNNKEITFEQINSMKYLDAIVTETLRKWPVGGAILDRECNKDYFVKDAFGAERDYIIKAGTVLLIPINGVQLDSKYYPNPDKFDPERFMAEENSTPDSMYYQPFGNGPRLCIGIRFAQLEVKVGIFSILKDYEIIPTKDSCIPIRMAKDTTVMMPENGFRVGLKLRKNKYK